jgi:hypothetical protein
VGLQDREWFQESRNNRSSARIHLPRRPARRVRFSHFVFLVLGIVIGMVVADLHWLDMLRQQLPF